MFWVTAIGVAIVAAGTAVSAYMAFLTYKQLGIANGQLWAALGQMKANEQQVLLAAQQLHDAEAGAATADKRQDDLITANRKLADATANNVELGNRAWVYASHTVIQGEGTHRGKWAYVVFVNGGRSPAQNVRTKAFIDAVPLGSAATAEVHRTGAIMYRGRSPCDGLASGKGTTLAPSQFRNAGFHLSGAEVAIFVLGCARYTTLGRAHWAESCQVALAEDGDGNIVPIERAHLFVCANYNRAD